LLPIAALGARDEKQRREAGLAGTAWPVTSQLNSMRTAASCCFTAGAE
jgi:hypothetical protein